MDSEKTEQLRALYNEGKRDCASGLEPKEGMPEQYYKGYGEHYADCMSADYYSGLQDENSEANVI